MLEQIKGLAAISDDIKKLTEAGAIVKIDIALGEGAGVVVPPAEPPVEPPADSSTRYRISCADKPSRQVKLRPQPSTTVGEIARLAHGTIVRQGSLKDYSVFANVYVEAQPAQIGWVEKEYLAEIS